MPVDLGDRVEDLKNELNPPGQDLYPTATDEVWLGKLINAFWNAVLEGVITGYVVDDDGLVSPTSGTTDMARDIQQVIVLYAAYNAVLMQVLNAKASFRAKAGPTEYETSQSATTLKAALDAARERLNIIIRRLGDLGSVNTAVLDAVVERTYSMAYGEQWWVR